MERKAASEQVSQRLKDQFAPIYLTLTSITQGVVLSFLASQCEATYAHLDGADWLLITATFVLVLSVWQEYVMQVLAFVWIPTLLDALVPFAFLAANSFWCILSSTTSALGSSCLVFSVLLGLSRGS